MMQMICASRCLNTGSTEVIIVQQRRNEIHRVKWLCRDSATCECHMRSKLLSFTLLSGISSKSEFCRFFY